MAPRLVPVCPHCGRVRCICPPKVAALPLRGRAVAAVVAACAVLALVSGCGAKYSEPFKDAPRSGEDNGEPADLIRMPDGFSNAATKCDHGNRIYIAYHGDSAYASIAVVPNDESCLR